jgi:hypothetical protein
MRSFRFAIAAMVAASAFTAAPAYAQTAPATPAKPKLVAPVRGEARIGTLKPDTKVVGDDVVTTIRVKNLMTAPVAGFRVEEFWYDKSNNLVPGSREIVRRPIQPGEVVTITLRTPKDARMSRNNYRFSHANGTVKAEVMKTLTS